MKLRVGEWTLDFYRICLYWNTVKMDRNFWADLVCFFCGGYYGKGKMYSFPNDFAYYHFCFLLRIKPYEEKFSFEDMIEAYHGSIEAYEDEVRYEFFPLEALD